MATKSQNAQNTPRRVDNTSGFKGVAWDARRGKWRADIRVPGGKRKHLGMHDDPAVGHAAYVAAAKELFGEFGRAS
ncbi:MAG TPA: AP2 domain-containing protein [Anaerolineae bacterium]|nr:AP2 domain-containing protein [Anaerolineae bacterium]